MDQEKRARLERAGWQVGSATRFLELRSEEAAYVELKLALSDAIRRERRRSGLSQAALADKMGSSQSRVSKMEAAHASVSVDLMIRTLLSMGVTRQEVARILGSDRRSA